MAQLDFRLQNVLFLFFYIYTHLVCIAFYSILLALIDRRVEKRQEMMWNIICLSTLKQITQSEPIKAFYVEYTVLRIGTNEIELWLCRITPHVTKAS